MTFEQQQQQQKMSGICFDVLDAIQNPTEFENSVYFFLFSMFSFSVFRFFLPFLCSLLSLSLFSLRASLWISFNYTVSPPTTSYFCCLRFTSSFLLLLPHLSSYLPFWSSFLSFITSVTASAWDYKRRVFFFFFSKRGSFQKSFK